MESLFETNVAIAESLDGKLETMPSIQDTYQYEPLAADDDIRLLTILPGDCNEGISCTLSHVSFPHHAHEPMPMKHMPMRRMPMR